jgi:hypothetical protein
MQSFSMLNLAVQTEKLGFKMLTNIALKISVVVVQVNLKSYIKFGFYFRP